MIADRLDRRRLAFHAHFVANRLGHGLAVALGQLFAQLVARAGSCLVTYLAWLDGLEQHDEPAAFLRGRLHFDSALGHVEHQ